MKIRTASEHAPQYTRIPSTVLFSEYAGNYSNKKKL
jgi:hypothetical protein